MFFFPSKRIITVYTNFSTITKSLPWEMSNLKKHQCGDLLTKSSSKINGNPLRRPVHWRWTAAGRGCLVTFSPNCKPSDANVNNTLCVRQTLLWVTATDQQTKSKSIFSNQTGHHHMASCWRCVGKCSGTFWKRLMSSSPSCCSAPPLHQRGAAPWLSGNKPQFSLRTQSVAPCDSPSTSLSSPVLPPPPVCLFAPSG